MSTGVCLNCFAKGDVITVNDKNLCPECVQKRIELHRNGLVRYSHAYREYRTAKFGTVYPENHRESQTS